MAFYEVLIFIIAAVGTILLPVGYRIFDQYKPIVISVLLDPTVENPRITLWQQVLFFISEKPSKPPFKAIFGS